MCLLNATLGGVMDRFAGHHRYISVTALFVLTDRNGFLIAMLDINVDHLEDRYKLKFLFKGLQVNNILLVYFSNWNSLLSISVIFKCI